MARFCDQCGTAIDPSGARILTIGAAPDNDVVLDFPIISGHHARLLLDAGGATLEDLGSTNGTAVGRPEERIHRRRLAASETVYFGSLPVAAARLLDGSMVLDPTRRQIPLAFSDAPSDASSLVASAPELLLGRDPDAGVVLDDPLVSWHHARLSRVGAQVFLEDLGSTNGTLVNGRPIQGRVELAVGARVHVGRRILCLSSPDQLERQGDTGQVTVQAHDLAVDVPGKRLLEGVSLTLYPGELVGLMGPSGAGKTTLMLAMNGYMRPSQGCVTYNGRDLFRAYDEFRLYLGYVPQEDIMHAELTVWEALYYSARLRLPPDTRRTEIDERIGGLLADLGLEGARDVRIGSARKKGISGGQRKRVNLAMELLTDPSILFLDEPTSGLSSEDALTVMKILRRLADGGKTLLLTLHQPSRQVFRRMDHLIVMGKDSGSPQPAGVAYFGPAYPDSIHFLSPEERPRPDPSPDRLLEGLGQRSSREWQQVYRGSPYQKKYIDQRAVATRAEELEGELARRETRGGLGQWRLLISRGLKIKTRDSVNSAILLLQAPVIALLILFVFGEQTRLAMSDTNWSETAPATATTLFLMAIAALWFGCSNAAREIVAEWPVYHRERMTNLGLSAYVGSKLALLGLVCAFQCSTLVAILHPGGGLLGPWWRLLGVTFLAGLVGMALGLLLSARAPSSEVAISLVPLALLPMVILGGILQAPHQMAAPMRWLSLLMPSRWAFEALLLAESAERPSWTPPAVPGQDPSVAQDLAEPYFPLADRGAEIWPIVLLLLMLLVSVVGILEILRARDVHRSRAGRWR
jgi:ABC-type multidrug transport system ATPase subunit/pSer/pThr/pTyr-binding forkhead associated (FHA) protein